jgi:ribonuclease HI
VQEITIKKRRSIHGETTNNKAYYIALIEGLEVALEHGVNETDIYMNSKLIAQRGALQPSMGEMLSRLYVTL